MRNVGFGFLLGVLVVGCAGFTYTRYGLDLENQKLLHYSDPRKDLQLSSCAKDPNRGYECVVMFDTDFYQMKTAYEQCEIKLAVCEKRCK